MNMQNQNTIEYTLINYFAGKITTEEETHVQKWISQSADNLIYYQNLQRLWVLRIVL